MKDDLINVNAEQLLKSLKYNGRASLFGIYFDFDKATVNPESKSTLDEIAKRLKENSTIKLHVVGHTDMVGSYE